MHAPELNHPQYIPLTYEHSYNFHKVPTYQDILNLILHLPLSIKRFLVGVFQFVHRCYWFKTSLSYRSLWYFLFSSIALLHLPNISTQRCLFLSIWSIKQSILWIQTKLFKSLASVRGLIYLTVACTFKSFKSWYYLCLILKTFYSCPLLMKDMSSLLDITRNTANFVMRW